MRVNTNSWNKFRYTLYTPFYDLMVRYFVQTRKNSIDGLNVQAGDKVLIIGAGTGLDLEFLPNNVEIIATDITPSMIEKIKARNKLLNKNVQATVMDGQVLCFENNSFDIIILHLILAVIPDSTACIKEAERVLKPGGKIAIFDKFLPKNRQISTLRKVINIFSNLFFTDITRSFESIIKNTELTVIADNDAGFNGNFRLIRLHKPQFV